MADSSVAVVEFEDYPRSVAAALDAVDAAGTLRTQGRVVLKPNIVNADPPPITTPPECVEAVLEYCRLHSTAEVFIAEGCGGLDTGEAFRQLGFTDLAKRKDVPLIDLDQEETVRLENPSFRLLPEFHMPKCLVDTFIVSIPVLKAHSMSTVTLAMKNMFGIAPAPFYAGPGYRKAKLHGSNNAELHRYVFELNQYCSPGLSVIDATVGMAQAHLWGPICDPPVNKILASHDPVAIDAVGSRLLGVDWRTVDHIVLADGRLGRAQ